MAMMLDRKAQINMTPMIDILLVLIIIFMVITPLTPTGLRTLVPQPAPADPAQAPPAQDIVITVCPDGMVRLNQEPVNLTDLRERLTLLFRGAADHVARPEALDNARVPRTEAVRVRAPLSTLVMPSGAKGAVRRPEGHAAHNLSRGVGYVGMKWQPSFKQG